MNLKEYQKTSADKKEDTRNAKKTGMSIESWKKTPKAIEIDKRDLKKLNKRKRVHTT